MKKVISVLALGGLLVACSGGSQPSMDMMTQASGKLYYAETSLTTPEKYVPFITNREGAVVVTTLNSDFSPNVVVVRPGVTPDGKYLQLGLSENRTKENISQRHDLIFVSYQYDKTGGANGKSLNIGFRMIAKYVGDTKNAELNTEFGTENTQYLEIVEVMPLG